MLLGNHSLAAVLQQRPDWDADWVEHSLDFLFMLLTKVLLNCVLAFNHGLQRPACSLMSLCFLSLCLADFLLAAALAVATTANRLLDCCDGYPGYEALVLTHASAVYAFLPLPVLVLGALDYASVARRGQDGGFRSRWPGGGVGQGAAVLALWVLAGLYSALHTDPSVLEVKRMPGALRWARVCDVRVARDVDLYCLLLLPAVGVVLLMHLPHVPRWTRLLHQVAPEMEAHGTQWKRNLPGTHNKMPVIYSNLPVSNSKMPVTHGNLPVTHNKMPVTHGDQAVWSVEMEMQHPCQRDPPIYVACVLLFAVPWCPYLLMHLSSQLLEMAVPSYVSVNTLWLSSANSLLAGITSWALARQEDTGGTTGASIQHLDPACDWRIPIYLSYRGNSSGPWNQVPLELQTQTSEKKLKPQLLI
ncbi:uncharacterized protein LOC134087355 [Sardina pilchardus]|uniref:uncharacterized protein LOC134087355 n=1 Tax=Sardina pilchardus TaxID=27697 RepID=UPI002E1350F6